MHRARRAAAVGVLGLAAVGVAACTSGPPTPTDPVLAKGQQIYNNRCQACHGPSGEGVTAPAFYGIAERMTLEQHEAVIAQGRDGTRMPAFADSLSQDDIEAVARYEREVIGVRS